MSTLKWVLVFLLGICIGWYAFVSKMLLTAVPMTKFDFQDVAIVDKIGSRPYHLCPHPNHTSCSIQKDTPCSFQHYSFSESHLLGRMFTINASNMNLDQLDDFCGAKMHKGYKGYKPLMSSENNRHFTSHENTTSATCNRTITTHIMQLPSSSQNPVVLLPGWGFHFPGLMKNELSQDWNVYTTGILVNDTVCFWPIVPALAESERDLSLWSQGNNALDDSDRSPTQYKRVMISDGYLDNIWHASVILNTWCLMRGVEDLHFVFQYDTETPDPIYKWGGILGISRERIILQGFRPIVVEELLLNAPIMHVDWSCLHRVLRLPFDPETERYALLYVRSLRGLDRDIPDDISKDLENELERHFPHLKVKRFVGTEPLEELQSLFANAKIVIGPHGAGMVNVVFCQDSTPVVEFLTPGLSDRPWLMYGGHTFQLPWWPVLVDSFDSRSQILEAGLAVVKKALEQSQEP
jgi:Glycosyltransferase 61